MLTIIMHCFLIGSKGGHVALQQVDSQPPATPVKLQADPHPQVLQDAEQQIDNGVIQLNSEAEVASNIEKLYDQFTDLVVVIRISFETLITSGKHTVHEVALQANVYLKRPISKGSIDEVFNDIQPHYDFLSFEIIKTLVRRFLPEDNHKELHTGLTQYIDDVKKLLQSSQLKHVRSAIKKKLPHLGLPASPSTSDQTKPVVIELNELWDNMTFENLKRVLQYYFKEVADLFSHISITIGSVIITLQIPTTQAQYLIDTINTKTNSMYRLGIMEVAVDNNTIPIRREDDNNFDVSLHQSVKAGDSFEVSLLLQLGANPNNKDEEGKYPVETAREGGHDKVIQTLLTGGAIDSKLFNYIHGHGLCN